MHKTFKLPEFGYEVTIGKFANQADGAAWFNQGGTIVLSTVISAESKDFPGFLPLTVDYREMFSAAGKIPGGYFKREGRATDKEVLTSRFIDRSIRPLFPSKFFNQLQVLSTVYSVDKEHSPGILALMATSVALSTSKLPFMGPIGAVEMCRIDGKWVVNPKYQEGLKADARFIIVGTEEGIAMVEGNADQISEETFIDVLFMAHEAIKKLVAWQLEIQKELNVQKEELQDPYNWDVWSEKINAFLTQDRVKSISIPDKVERYARLKAVKEEFVSQNRDDIDAAAHPELLEKVVNYIIDRTLEVKLTDLVLEEKKRIDGRPFDQVRPISIEVGLLPFAHGSALFKRGRTQALATATLGGGDDEQRIENLMEDDSAPGKFMLHYNFPSFSVGEVRPQRGPGRREVGHGYLAQSALRRVLPDSKEFPYTIRIVSDILESDGSSSMATVCGSTMALMQAGVPIKKMVSGIAMGLLKSSSQDEFAVLSDITGMEDAFGLMDFKVTGTDEGITAIQMDIKYKGGLSRSVFERALKQAREGRLHILKEMQKVMDKPNKDLSDLVPKLVMVKINQDKIGAIIGSGGKVIKEIIATTGTNIDIEPDGTVKIFGSPGALMDQAINWVKTLAGQIEPGTEYHGKVRRLADFGLFVELVPGLDGLVHVSNIPKNKQKTFLRDFKQDDMVTVQVIEYDASTGRVRLRLIDEPTKE